MGGEVEERVVFDLVELVWAGVGVVGNVEDVDEGCGGFGVDVEVVPVVVRKVVVGEC
jgi:hypothetical protein